MSEIKIVFGKKMYRLHNVFLYTVICRENYISYFLGMYLCGANSFFFFRPKIHTYTSFASVIMPSLMLIHDT